MCYVEKLGKSNRITMMYSLCIVNNINSIGTCLVYSMEQTTCHLLWQPDLRTARMQLIPSHSSLKKLHTHEINKKTICRFSNSALFLFFEQKGDQVSGKSLIRVFAMILKKDIIQHKQKIIAMFPQRHRTFYKHASVRDLFPPQETTNNFMKLVSP
ncbi:uncharacterized protein BYT42DRAFT_334296 [Radiomyces spectabilis]|uniref:uncharacterized protein n=1 Tax=Radiomyces spectabilis TaxID=64574 RepID=UPI00221F1CEE|nr:uncharacterized protein BYT42DRAFT_334296 [Radiomyces spectabilis]KAI8379637.1 hypothetical protein BYT42DRAFT_334296 [Radiomyces spectabilis]